MSARRYRGIERARWSRFQRTVRCAQNASSELGSLARSRDQAQWKCRELDDLACSRAKGVGRELEGCGLAWGMPRRLLGRRIGRRVKHQRAQLDRRDAIDHAVVDLADRADPPVVELIRDPEL